MRAGGQEERQRAAGGGMITGGDGVEIDATEFQICLGGAVSEISGIAVPRPLGGSLTCHFRHAGLYEAPPSRAPFSFKNMYRACWSRFWGARLGSSHAG